MQNKNTLTPSRVSTYKYLNRCDSGSIIASCIFLLATSKGYLQMKIQCNTSTVEHATFTTSNIHGFKVPGLIAICNFHVLRTYTFRGSCQSFLL